MHLVHTEPVLEPFFCICSQPRQPNHQTELCLRHERKASSKGVDCSRHESVQAANARSEPTRDSRFWHHWVIENVFSFWFRCSVLADRRYTRWPPTGEAIDWVCPRSGSFQRARLEDMDRIGSHSRRIRQPLSRRDTLWYLSIGSAPELNPCDASTRTIPMQSGN